MKKNSLYTLVVFISLLSFSAGLTCYSCGSDYNQISCDKFLPHVKEFQKECDSSYNSCVYTKGVFQDVEVMSRECGTGEPMNSCGTRSLGGGARATVCSCAGDICNMNFTSASSSSSALSFITAAVISLIIAR
ncbi:uncharacterized protein LOC111698633 isoform X2 [Eurytemora carolleeae]|uniref:uncharacterized protein LOC111698633 isoform X2 n=1 Tax=Eurytemora carolleeae TaxID=1294199 RepID=UPI000C757A98|nr:uncharacterized protein LOC111698633 isoform X2 [Eurytemora carolleeae]|eukprot:XP_023324778.1 uncharacterized protein LOC111698633 isoform X2 [Eurytemora affinis]